MIKINALPDILAERASTETHRLAYRFLTNSGEEETVISYGQLHRSAKLIAAHLLMQLKAGDRALLLYPPGLEFVKAYFGCLYAGIIAIPAYPPHPARLDRTLPVLESIAKDASPAAALITNLLHSSIRNSSTDISRSQFVKMD